MKGILFRPSMIRAIANGSKTQTRRVIKPQPIESVNELKEHSQVRGYWIPYALDHRLVNNNAGSRKNDCGYLPRFQLGDIVYIKETVKIMDFGDHKGVVAYKTTVNPPKKADALKWHSPLFMPAWAARYFIQITSVRAERLQEINKVRHDDVLKEGYPFGYDVATLNEHPVTTYARLWDSINKEHQWASNPWVFVYSFKLTKREGRQRR